MKNEQLIKQLTPKQVRQSLYYSQLLFLTIALLLAFLFFREQIDWANLFVLSYQDIFLYGFGAAIIVVIFEIVLHNYLPSAYFDDGGINEKVFKDASVMHIFFIVLLVAICEEILFRGVLQTVFGYFIASSIFALMHYRYLRKFLLFSLLVFISFLIGYLFELTGSLIVTIVFHFTVDFLLGLYIAKRL